MENFPKLYAFDKCSHSSVGRESGCTLGRTEYSCLEVIRDSYEFGQEICETSPFYRWMSLY